MKPCYIEQILRVSSLFIYEEVPHYSKKAWKRTLPMISSLMCKTWWITLKFSRAIYHNNRLISSIHSKPRSIPYLTFMVALWIKKKIKLFLFTEMLIHCLSGQGKLKSNCMIVLTLTFSAWAANDLSKSSCFLIKASTPSRESPKLSSARKALEEKQFSDRCYLHSMHYFLLINS